MTKLLLAGSVQNGTRDWWRSAYLSPFTKDACLGYALPWLPFGSGSLGANSDIHCDMLTTGMISEDVDCCRG